MPSKIPNPSGEKPMLMRYSGRTALTDSDEMSVRRLLTPSILTLRSTCRPRPRRRSLPPPSPPDAPGSSAPGPRGPSGVSAALAGRPRTEEYTGPSRPRRTTTVGQSGVLQANLDPDLFAAGAPGAPGTGPRTNRSEPIVAAS